MADSVNPVSQSELLTALDALILQEKSELSEDDVTIQRLAKRSGWSPAKAKEVIERWVNEDKLEFAGKKRQAKTGRMIYAWKLKLET